MAEMVIQYPDHLLGASGKSREEVERELRFQFAARMYELGEYSTSQAAQAVGISKFAFIEALGKARIPLINFDDDEIAAELNAIRGNNRR